MTPCIFQISISPGGVPKLPIPEAEVGPMGLVGDGHNAPDIHGGPDKAVCLWSQEVIEQLREEGHNLAAGYAGENITIAGLDWNTVVPGIQLQLGKLVRLEVVSYTTPCRKNMHWFADKRYSRIHQKHHPGFSRVYARVLQTGTIRTGDAVAIAAHPAAE
ncbi:MAG: MOSC domain-containing protein [Leptolyngbyaceae cyanobacterium T60_A2020_046]|nr:MOSC domain-containing protein [Leptolyngbyaceae cyanobacterium T60_A2020_046]